MKCFLKKENKERKEELEKGCMKIRVNLLPCLKKYYNADTNQAFAQHRNNTCNSFETKS